MPTALGDDSGVFGRRAWWLGYCIEKAFEATTLEGAVKWHARIVRELTRRLEIVSRKDWPIMSRAQVIFDLMHERIDHNNAILNIDRALQREQDVDWQWWQ